MQEERRKIARHRTLKAGSISFNRAGGIDCRVRNLSPAGACLEVASQLGVPDDFVLVVASDHLHRAVPRHLAHGDAPGRRIPRRGLERAGEAAAVDQQILPGDVAGLRRA